MSKTLIITIMIAGLLMGTATKARNFAENLNNRYARIEMSIQVC